MRGSASKGTFGHRRCRWAAGKLGEAEGIYRETLALAREKLGEPDTLTLAVKHNLGSVLLATEHYDEADNLLEAALEGRRARFGVESPWAQFTIGQLVKLLERRSALDPSSDYGKRAAEMRALLKK